MENAKQLHRIGVLTSGGDAPGMNAAIRAVVRTCIRNNIVPIGIRRGYNGLINSDVQVMTAQMVSGMASRGGTMLYTARCLEFITPEGQARAIQNCRYLGIDGLVCIGGDGTFKGARVLANAGISTIAIPATIDNDIPCTNYAIGFDTAANTAIEAIDRLSDTMQSHERVSVVEIMGNNAGHLALYVGMSVGAAVIITPEKDFDFEKDLMERMRESHYNGHTHFIVVVAEGCKGEKSSQAIAERIRKETGRDTRVTTLGHIQRGGSPSARDRTMSSRMGHYAVSQLIEGQSNIVVCYENGEFISRPINEALEMTHNLDETMYKIAMDLAI